MRNKNQRLSKEEIEIIRKLTEEGKSLNYLSKLLNINKPTIYYQVRKFKPRIKKEFIVNLSDFQIGELIGAFAGDGNYYHQNYNKNFPNREIPYRITYYLTFPKERDYAYYLQALLKNLNLNPYLIERPSVFALVVKSKEFINFIKNYLIWEKDKTFTIRLKNNLSQYSNEFLKGFARGLMDTDGFMSPGNAVCACISKELINNLSDIFDKFGLKTTRRILDRGGNTRPLNFVRVRRMSLNDYSKIIGFSNSNKAKTLNSILNKQSQVLKS
ncbi:MAG: LAGLIDADG family homing endonuclease [Nanoarchaeota archaeon]